MLQETFYVKRELIIHRLLEIGLFTKDDYDQFADKIREQEKVWQEYSEKERKDKENQGNKVKDKNNRYVARKTIENNGLLLCKVLLLGFEEDYFSEEDLSGLLGIEEMHIPAFIAEMKKW
jgi:hypothetical protein